MGGERTAITYRPIGVVRSPYAEPAGTPIQCALAPEGEGTIEILEEYTKGLADLDGFSHIWVIYHFHRSRGFELKVTPFMDDVERGLFSTRAPRRPNPVGLSLLRLLRIEGSVLHVAELDILDGTPVLDIKPHFPAVDTRPDVKSGWLDDVDTETRRKRGRADGRFSG